MTTVGSLVYQFFEHHLKAEKGLSQASIRSYRDGIRLFLLFLAKTTHRPISKRALSDLGAHNVRDFLAHLEAERGNHIRTRNQRLAALHMSGSVQRLGGSRRERNDHPNRCRLGDRELGWVLHRAASSSRFPSHADH